MATDYSTMWRQGDAGGAVGWQDSLSEGAYAGQLKAKAGGSSDDYLQRFESLGKSDSSVDNETGWRTVTNLENSNPANVESIKKQAEEWKAQGFDVRIQDLDQSHGAEWADLAVRKTDRVKQAPIPEPEPEKEILPDSSKLAEAKQRVKTWEGDRWSGKYADDLYHDQADTTNWLNKYKMKLSSVKADPSNASSRIGQI